PKYLAPPARGRAGSSCGFLPGKVLQLSHANSDSAAFGQTCEHAYATDADVVADRRKRKAARRNAKVLAVPAFPRPPFALSCGTRDDLQRGRSSVVERQLPKLYVEGSIPFARSNSLRRHHFSPASGKTTPASVVICEAGGRSYAAAENRLPIGNVDDPDLWGFWARSRRCVVQVSCEAMSNENVSCGIFKSNQDQRRGYCAASGVQWKPCRPGRTNSLFWALRSGERPGNRRQRFCET